MVRPRADELGQFTALLKYRGWSQFPQSLPKHLRQEILPDVGEALTIPELMRAASEGRIDVREQVARVLPEALGNLGLELQHLLALEATLGPRTDDLRTEDRAELHPSPPLE